MKKLILLIGIICISLYGYSQKGQITADKVIAKTSLTIGNEVVVQNDVKN